jgi:hypothetical protein
MATSGVWNGPKSAMPSNVAGLFSPKPATASIGTKIGRAGLAAVKEAALILALTCAQELSGVPLAKGVPTGVIAIGELTVEGNVEEFEVALNAIVLEPSVLIVSFSSVMRKPFMKESGGCISSYHHLRLITCRLGIQGRSGGNSNNLKDPEK